MRNLIGLVLVAGMLVFSSSANAEERTFDWSGPQVDAYLNFSLPLQENLSFLISIEAFWICDTGNTMSFTQIGVSQRLTDWYTASVMIGVTGNFPQDRTSFITGFQNYFSFLDGALTLLVNPNFIVAYDSLTYFGVYAFDLHLHGVNMGLRAEQIDTGVMLGPRVGYTISVWHIEVQYQMGVQEENYGHTARIVYGLSF